MADLCCPAMPAQVLVARFGCIPVPITDYVMQVGVH